MIPNSKATVFAFDLTTGEPVTGDAANITAEWSKDYGTRTALTDTTPDEEGDGYYTFDLTNDERTVTTNARIFPESSTANVQVIGAPFAYSVNGGFIVLPLNGTLQDGVDGTNIKTYTGESKTVGIGLVDAEGNDVDVTGLELHIVIEDRFGDDVAVIPDGSIAKAEDTIAFTIPSDATTEPRVLQWALRDADDNRLLGGNINVVYAPAAD